MIWRMVTRREKARKQSLAHQTVSSVSEQLSLKSCFRTLRDNWTASQTRTEQAVSFHETRLLSKLLSSLARYRHKAVELRVAFAHVQQTRMMQSQQRAYQHWMETYVLSKALAAAEHTYQSNLLRNCMLAIRR